MKGDRANVVRPRPAREGPVRGARDLAERSELHPSSVRHPRIGRGCSAQCRRTRSTPRRGGASRDGQGEDAAIVEAIADALPCVAAVTAYVDAVVKGAGVDAAWIVRVAGDANGAAAPEHNVDGFERLIAQGEAGDRIAGGGVD